MGAFRYCRKCESPLGKPTPSEDMLDAQKCTFCKSEQQRLFTTDEWVVEAFDEIVKLREELAKIRNSGFVKLDKRIQRLSKQNRLLKKEITELKIKLEKEYVI